ncbi:hypothetical protein [Micromonospora sp. NBC_01796]|uniref:hypothetical protein n=1 Tax=Micromonospora sp. NBC_01796 TaxID=2975987 RepID=UPI002DD7CC2B|nr:hypothetical protein [Micromonospora sp. NBC_01796]WSA85047.1 hypothetical protein OIE47_32590 [Micromonospora sp. NBC_01796]
MPDDGGVRVGWARAVATDWVSLHARDEAGFVGAFFSGSTTWLPADAELPPTSDVDVVVVMEGEPPALKLGKFRHRGVLLEVTHLSRDEFDPPERVLATFYLASSFRTDTIIADPTGILGRLRSLVSASFAEPTWVRARCEHASRRIETGLAAVDVSAPLHERVLAWMFPASVTTQVLLVAALRNPTVRLRYLAARGVLADHGHLDRYPDLLELLGCARMTGGRVAYHLRRLAHTFDATAEVSRTPFFFSADITTAARPVAIDGSRALVERGDHREAVFWIAVTFARCHRILAVDAPPGLRDALAPAFEELVADLGLTTGADLRRRTAEVLGFLPELWRTTESILATIPGIRSR